jgi:hypothetical protein
MKVIIAGPRDFNDYNVVVEAIKESGFEITEVVSGKASGVDSLGEIYAMTNEIPIQPFPVDDWKRSDGTIDYAAGPRRNARMAKYANALIAISVGPKGSKGTNNMIQQARRHKLKVYVKRIEYGS